MYIMKSFKIFKDIRVTKKVFPIYRDELSTKHVGIYKEDIMQLTNIFINYLYVLKIDRSIFYSVVAQRCGQRSQSRLGGRALRLEKNMGRTCTIFFSILFFMPFSLIVNDLEFLSFSFVSCSFCIVTAPLPSPSTSHIKVTFLVAFLLELVKKAPPPTRIISSKNY